MIKKAYLAGGCFWGMEELFRKLDGVIDTETGYTGGINDNPNYQNHPGHAEVLEIVYDNEIIKYKNLLDFFYRVHNPTTKNQQGNDIGPAYRSAIFYQNDEEKKEAEEFIKIVDDSKRWGSEVVTTLEPYKQFFKAEEFHQDYLNKYPDGYTCHYVRFPTFLS
jgi:peptide-methionine (S)-S-oxide reductase